MIQEDVKDFLAHYGKKGMKWGQRNNARTQGKIDVLKRIANDTATNKDFRKAHSIQGLSFTKNRAKSRAELNIKRGKEAQNNIMLGKNKVNDILLKAQGITIKDLDYNRT